VGRRVGCGRGGRAPVYFTIVWIAVCVHWFLADVLVLGTLSLSVSLAWLLFIFRLSSWRGVLWASHHMPILLSFSLFSMTLPASLPVSLRFFGRLDCPPPSYPSSSRVLSFCLKHTRFFPPTFSSSSVGHPGVGRRKCRNPSPTHFSQSWCLSCLTTSFGVLWKLFRDFFFFLL